MNLYQSVVDCGEKRLGTVLGQIRWRAFWMDTEHIKKIFVDEQGRLHLVTSDRKFPMIYREAAGIGWNQVSHSVHSSIPNEWSYLTWFNHIVDTIQKECNCKLSVTNETQFQNISSDLLQ